MLGIKVCTDTDRISEINYENKLTEIQRILKKVGAMDIYLHCQWRLSVSRVEDPAGLPQSCCAALPELGQWHRLGTASALR